MHGCFPQSIADAPNNTASSMAPTAMTASTISELVPAPGQHGRHGAHTGPDDAAVASPVAEVKPSARAFAGPSLREVPVVAARQMGGPLQR
jgi:hypothetical protein